MDTLKLDDEIALKVQVGDKEFEVSDPWELDEIFSAMWQKAADENEKRQREYKEAVEKGETTKLELVSERDVYKNVRDFVSTKYKVDLSIGHANALYLLIKKAVAAKKQHWLDSFKLNAN